MFERFSERARRIVFFARYEASVFGASSIDTHHLLLAILREYPVFARDGCAESVRREIELEYPKGPSTPTSEDLPLSDAGKRVLGLSAKQADGMGSLTIEGGHLLLAILLLEDGFVGELLRKNGIDPDFVKSKMRPELVTAPSFFTVVGRLEAMGITARGRLLKFTEDEATESIERNGWSRKQGVGSLIDWASTHHQWFARALVETEVRAAGYPEIEWVEAQNYARLPWAKLVDTWLSMNSLLAQVLSAAPEERAGVLCRVGTLDPVPFSQLAANYMENCEDLLRAILKRG